MQNPALIGWFTRLLKLLYYGLVCALAMMFDTLAMSTHRIRTGFGVSEASFAPPCDIAFQGCGQGNGAGPPIWAAVSSILILMMEAAGFGFECLSALSRRLITAQCFAFVDDTDAIEAAKDVNSSIEDIFPDVQAAAKLWSGGIQATGGATNPDKSFCWLLDHQWNPQTGKWRFRTVDPADKLTLYIYGLSRKLEPLTLKQPNQSERTLGVMLAPLEDHEAQFQFVLEKAKEWVSATLFTTIRCVSYVKDYHSQVTGISFRIIYSQRCSMECCDVFHFGSVSSKGRGLPQIPSFHGICSNEISGSGYSSSFFHSNVPSSGYAPQTPG